MPHGLLSTSQRDVHHLDGPQSALDTCMPLQVPSTESLGLMQLLLRSWSITWELLLQGTVAKSLLGLAGKGWNSLFSRCFKVSDLCTLTTRHYFPHFQNKLSNATKGLGAISPAETILMWGRAMHGHRSLGGCMYIWCSLEDFQVLLVSKAPAKDCWSSFSSWKVKRERISWTSKFAFHRVSGVWCRFQYALAFRWGFIGSSTAGICLYPREHLGLGDAMVQESFACLAGWDTRSMDGTELRVAASGEVLGFFQMFWGCTYFLLNYSSYHVCCWWVISSLSDSVYIPTCAN